MGLADGEGPAGPSTVRNFAARRRSHENGAAREGPRRSEEVRRNITAGSGWLDTQRWRSPVSTGWAIRRSGTAL